MTDGPSPMFGKVKCQRTAVPASGVCLPLFMPYHSGETIYFVGTELMYPGTQGIVNIYRFESGQISGPVIWTCFPPPSEYTEPIRVFGGNDVTKPRLVFDAGSTLAINVDNPTVSGQIIAITTYLVEV